VAAAVPDVGERVVLGEESDRRTFGTRSRAERGLEPTDATLDPMTGALE
jgi:hypothetical protein